MKKLLISTALVFASTPLLATESPQWNTASISYQKTDADDADFRGFALDGTVLVNENVYLTGDASSTSDDVRGLDIDYRRFSLGVGYQFAVNETTDFFTQLTYEDLSLKASRNNDYLEIDGNGYGVTAGLRSMYYDRVEMLGSVGFVEIENDEELEFTIGAKYHFNDQFSAGVEYNKLDEFRTTSLKLTYAF
ncbi:MAG: outer membrane beta-barrel protein [Psychrobium sp.]